MKNALLGLFSALLLLSGFGASAQFVTSAGNKDTSIGFYNGDPQLLVHNDVKSTTSNPVYLKWHVVDSYFGPGWDIVTSGFCDNVVCYSAFDTFSNLFTNHTVFKSDAYTSAGYGDFKMTFNTTVAPPNGTSAWVRVYAQDTVSGVSRTLTYIGYKNSTGITTTVNSNDEVILYPNPARESVNVIFDSKSGVKTIAIYNLIGKLVSPIYRPSGNNSAKLDINEYPAGIYFIRLMNSNGQVVATRRFVHQ